MTKKKVKHTSHKEDHSHEDSQPRKRTVKKKGYPVGLIVFLVLVVAVIAVIWLTHLSGQGRLTREMEVAAIVNDQPIMMSYIDDQYDKVPDMYKGFITKLSLLNQTINEELLLQAAEEEGIEVSAEDVRAEIDAALLRSGLTEEDLDARLAEQNITREYLEELYGKQLKINMLLEKVVFPGITVSEDEVSDLYDSRIRAMHVLVDTEEEALDIIEDLKGSTLDGIVADFQAIAEEKSIDPSAQTNKGDLGEFSMGQMVPAFERAAFALEEYTFTAEPVETQFGYHVILRVPKEQTLEEQYAVLEEALLNQKKAQAVPEYIDELRSSAHIQVFYDGSDEEPVATSGTVELPLADVE